MDDLETTRPTPRVKRPARSGGARRRIGHPRPHSDRPQTEGSGARDGGGSAGIGAAEQPGSTTSANPDLRSAWSVLAGAVLLPLGVSFILMAWYGAAHTHFVQQQIPYLVSGSFAGLGCLVLGGLLYWSHWLYRLFDQADKHHEEDLTALHELIVALGSRSSPPGPGAPGSYDPSTASPRESFPNTFLGNLTASPASPAEYRPLFVATATGSDYHRPGCPIVAHHPDGLRTLAAHEVVNLQPCRICLG